MRILLLCLVCAALGFPARAHAGTDDKDLKDLKITPEIRPPTDAGPYVAVDGGLNLAQDTGAKKVVESQNGFPTDTISGTGSGGLGAVGGLKVGYNFKSYDFGDGFGLQPAVEVEAYYLNSYSKQSYAASSDTFYPPNAYRARYNDAAFMLNGLARFKTGTLFTPYLGAGIGGEYLSNSSVSLYAPSLGVKAHLAGDDDLVFAVQGIAGVDIEVAKHWDIFTEYKFIAGIDPTLSNTTTFFNVPAVANGNYVAKYQPDYLGQHLITAGLKYNF